MPEIIPLSRISLLLADPKHAPDMARIHANVFQPPWDAQAFDALLQNPSNLSFIARVTNDVEPHGFVLAQMVVDEIEILSIGVERTWQRRGLGAALLGALMRGSAGAGAKAAHLEVAADNRAALALYERAGFRQVGKRQGYYGATGGPAVDALRLAAVLDVGRAAGAGAGGLGERAGVGS